ncbi:hypothetical protein LDENG_00277730 [Lucifuga dentata]|nr:hypothetical protein LDENG_00277730 [Lucifuga dentata]
MVDCDADMVLQNQLDGYEAKIRELTEAKKDFVDRYVNEYEKNHVLTEEHNALKDLSLERELEDLRSLEVHRQRHDVLFTQEVQKNQALSENLQVQTEKNTVLQNELEVLRILLEENQDKATQFDQQTVKLQEKVEILTAQVHEEAQENQALSEDLKLQEQQNVALAADLNQSNTALRKELEELLNESNTVLRKQLEGLEAQKKNKKAGWKRFFCLKKKKKSGQEQEGTTN